MNWNTVYYSIMKVITLAVGFVLSSMFMGSYFASATTTSYFDNKIAINGSVNGKVLLSPVCPVERIPPDPACAPKPYITNIQVWSTRTRSLYKSIFTNSVGAFTLSLVPGPYVLQVKKPVNGSLYPRCSETKFLITSKKTLKLTVICDTGIR